MTLPIDAIEAVNDDAAADIEANGAGRGHRRLVTVDNKDNGDTLKLRVPVSATIDQVIEAMYAEFRLAQDGDDRLSCRGNGEDVYQYGPRTLAQYLDEADCHNLHWSFAGSTGGA